jgi:hypothetical protein
MDSSPAESHPAQALALGATVYSRLRALGASHELAELAAGGAE